MQIGIFERSFPRDTLGEALAAVKALGLSHIQFDLCSAGEPSLPDVIAPELGASIRAETERHGINIVAVSGTFNMAHPAIAERQLGLARLRTLAQACAGMGTSTITLCTGTRNTESMWQPHADNQTRTAWRDMVDCVRTAVRIAAEHKVTLAFEPEVNNVVDSAHKARRLLNEIGSPNLKVIFDGANIFHAGELPHMREILQESIELLRHDIALAHAKDLDHDGDAGHLAAGQGLLDYDWYIAQLRRVGFDGVLVLHGLSEAQAAGCVQFLREKIASTGLTNRG
jgi:sugar phosphate isomerase/epimerase